MVVFWVLENIERVGIKDIIFIENLMFCGLLVDFIIYNTMLFSFGWLYELLVMYRGGTKITETFCYLFLKLMPFIIQPNFDLKYYNQIKTQHNF